MFTLNAQKRDDVPLQKVREEGRMPIVMYGPTVESAALSVVQTEFVKAWKELGGTGVVSIDVDGKKIEAVIKDVQYDPILHTPVHADLYVIVKGQKMEVSVPLTFEGLSPAVKQGGTLMKALHELDLEGEAHNVPSSIEVDVTTLVDLDSQIFAKDVKLPSGFSLVTSPDELVVAVEDAREAEPEEVAEEVDLSSIEVEKKGKKEEEEDTEEPAS